jgi:phasin family protein
MLRCNIPSEIREIQGGYYFSGEIMFFNFDQYSASSKALLDTHTTTVNALAGNLLQGVERIASLNLAAAKASSEEFSANLGKLLAAKDPQEFFGLSAAQFQPNLEKASSYTRHLSEICSESGVAIARAIETQVAEASRAAAAVVDQLSTNAPAGTDDAMAMVKSMMGNGNAFYEQVTKLVKQTTDAMQAQARNFAGSYVQPAQQAEKVVSIVTQSA